MVFVPPRPPKINGNLPPRCGAPPSIPAMTAVRIHHPRVNTKKPASFSAGRLGSLSVESDRNPIPFHRRPVTTPLGKSLST
jgi:hypothetical protein